MASRKTALVTGACGFVGAHMTEHLIAKGYAVVAADHPLADRGVLPRGVEFVPLDLAEPESLKALERFTFQKVFHIAGVFDYEAGWDRLYAVNCLGTRHLLKALLKRKSALESVVVWSSGSVYGRNFGGTPVSEEDPPAPLNDYELSKLLQEQEALKFHQAYGLPVVAIRPSAIYGPRSRYGLAAVLFLMRRGFLRFVPRGCDHVGGYVHVEDVAAAAEFLSDRPEAAGHVFNLTDDSLLTLAQAIRLSASLLGVRLWPLPIPMTLVRLAARADRLRGRALGRRPLLEPDLVDYLGRSFWMKNAKLKREGYKFRYPTLADGLPGTVAWYRRAGWL